MNKNRLLLNQKRFLSFSNYKNYIKQTINNNNSSRFFINSNKPIINLILSKEIKSNNNNKKPHNVFIFRNKSNKSIDNNIRILSINKNKSKLDLSGYSLFENQTNRLSYNQVINNNPNINSNYIDRINELLKKNSTRFHISKRFTQDMDEKNKTINTKFNPRNNTSLKAYYRYDSFCHLENSKENEKPRSVIERKFVNKSNRKLSKELFKKEINGIYVKKSGNKKTKYKIIGTLTTEPNLKYSAKT